MRTRRIVLALRRADFGHVGGEEALPHATQVDHDAYPALQGLFARAFVPGESYRATVVAHPLRASSRAGPRRSNARKGSTASGSCSRR